MKAMLPLCLVLTCFILSGYCTCLTCSNSCCANSSCSQSCQSCVVPGNCRNPALQMPVIDPLELSPLYEHVIILNGNALEVDNICLTYFPVTTRSNVFIFFRSITMKDGSNVIETYISGPARGCSGVARAQGISSDNCKGCKSCAFNYYMLGLACPETFVLYRCYFQGDCDVIDANQEVRAGLSSHRNLSQCCKDNIVALANQQLDIFYLERNFYQLPGELDRCCVKYWNGAPCINAHKIHSRDAISMPGQKRCDQHEHTEL